MENEQTISLELFAQVKELAKANKTLHIEATKMRNEINMLKREKRKYEKAEEKAEIEKMVQAMIRKESSIQWENTANIFVQTILPHFIPVVPDILTKISSILGIGNVYEHPTMPIPETEEKQQQEQFQEAA